VVTGDPKEESAITRQESLGVETFFHRIPEGGNISIEFLGEETFP